jgi:hypothetical protein
MGSYQPSLSGLSYSFIVTRQFLPGYSQSRVPALSPMAYSKIAAPTNRS